MWNWEEEIMKLCEEWEKESKTEERENYLYLNKGKRTSETGKYQLILNGMELWYGTVEEIYAVVQSMLRLLKGEYFS